TNGTLKGDRHTHDYSSGGTHEWGHGLQFIGGKNLEVDHLVVTDVTGDGLNSGAFGSRTRPELLARIMHSPSTKNLEQGAFTDEGDKTDSSEKTRTIEPYDISTTGGEFEFGYTMGYQGYPHVKGRVYQAYFYDDQMNFIEMKQCLQFKKVTVPEGAKFMHMEFNQPEVVGNAQGTIGRITNFTPSTDVHVHNNHVMTNRRLGLGYAGGQRWVIENNRIEANGGTAPAYG